MVDFSSPRPLFRNVYRLVDKQTKEPCEADPDIFSVIDSHQTSLYDIEPCQRRTTIKSQYDQMYRSVERVPPHRPTPRAGKRSPVLPNSPSDQTHDTSDGRKGRDFYLRSSYNTERASPQSRYHSSTRAIPQTSNMARKKISFYDLKDSDEVLQKIKQHSQTGVFGEENSAYAKLSSMTTRPNVKSDFRKSTMLPVLSPPNMACSRDSYLEKEALSREKDVAGRRQKCDTLLAAFERKNNIDHTKFSRKDLKEFMLKSYNLTVTELTAIEGIHFCRGKLMEKSPTFDREKLLDWMIIQLPILQNANTIQNKTIEKSGKCTFKTVRSPRGKSSDSGEGMVDKVLETASMNSRTKQKLVNTLMLLDAEVAQERSKQGMLAQMAAQRRLAQRAKQQSKERAEEVQRQLIATCHYDSAVRSINLAQQMNPSWSEGKNSYQVVSQLSETQKRRLIEMRDRRLEFPK